MAGLDVQQTGTTLVDEVSRSLEHYDGGTSVVIIKIEYQQVGGVTPAIARVIAEVFATFGTVAIGTKVIKFIRGTSTYSQHSYGNAVDFMWAYPGALHHDVAFWLNARRGELDIHWLGADPWFPSPLHNHYNHIHVDCYPQWGGDPYTDGHPI